MAGIYLHIPFCKRACYYCNFHFSTSTRYKDLLLQAIKKELTLQRNYLNQATINSIYWGGGTPSILAPKEVKTLLVHIKKTFPCAPTLEVTLEANPDDLSFDKLQRLHAIGINRLSIGIQSFDDTLLQSINRIHTAQQALDCIANARKVGFKQLNIDLMYALPQGSYTQWKRDLGIAMELGCEHISAYCLTIEKNTFFGQRKERGKLVSVPDQEAALQFELLLKVLEKNGYTHYEISNFCLQQHYALHNTNYWRNVPYLGVGPSAHSYNGHTRQSNIRNNRKYIAHLQQGVIPYRSEVLTLQDKVNEYIMTSLRTMWGCNLQYLEHQYKYDLYKKSMQDICLFIQKGLLLKQGHTLLLTRKGKLLADKIVASLFCIC